MKVRGQVPGEADASIYSGTKGAVDAITRGLAAELGPRKIRVNAIAPGGVETEGTRSAGMIGSDFEKAMIAGTPLGRIGQPDDIARVAVFLASDDSAWLTGERLTASPATGKGAARRSWSRRTSSSDAVPPRRSPPRRASHSSTTPSSRDAHIWLASAERRGWCP